MIISIVKKNLDEFLSKKIWIMVFTFSMVEINLLKGAKVANLTYWEFIIAGITDHYYILYFMIIFYLFSIFKIMQNDNEIILIRTDRYINYFVAKAISLFLISVIFVLMHVLIVAIIGYSFNMDNRFTMNTSFYNYSEVIGYYSTFFKTPILAIIAILVYMILGLTFIGMVFIIANHFFNKRLVIICMIVMHILMLISLRTNVDKCLAFLFMDNYIILHHALRNNVYVILLNQIFFTGCILFIVKKFWWVDITLKKKSIYKNGIVKWYIKILFSRKNIFIMIIGIIVSIINIMLRHSYLTINDLIVLQFYGHGVGYFNLIDFMGLIIYNGIPVYILSYFLEKESNDRSIFATIRLRTKKQWFLSVISCGFLLIFIYVLVSLSISILTGAFLGMNFNEYNYMNELFLENGLKTINHYYLYLIIITTKSLELFFYFLIIVISYLYTRGCTVGFLLVQVSYFSNFLVKDIAKYTPFGIGSLSRISEFVGNQGIAYLLAISILIIVNLVLYLYLRSGLYKRIFN